MKDAGPNDEYAVTAMSVSLQNWTLLISEAVNNEIQILLNEVWMVLNLQNRGMNFCIGQQIDENSCGSVGHADIACEALRQSLLESFPSLLQGNFSETDFAFHGAVLCPAGWVPYFRVNVFKRNREMDKDKVEVVESPVLKRTLD